MARARQSAALKALEQYGFLLLTDTRLPSVAGTVAGETVRGSWWAHAKSHAIFRASCELAEHPDVLVVKLISGKNTFVHRRLWPAFLAVAAGCERWQTAGLSKSARRLFERVQGFGQISSEEQMSKSLGEASRELEKRILIFSEQVHTEKGAHAKVLESWRHWTRRVGSELPKIKPEQARRKLEELLDNLNLQFQARGKLPWQ
jgi:hypothetical protein